MIEDLLDRASDEAFARFAAAGEDFSALPDPIKTVVIVCGAQGVIDNGGLDYFYRGDWPGQPPYSTFSEAYRRIGATLAAESIEGTASLFPFAEPHRHKELRRQYLDGELSPEYLEL